MSQRFGLNYLDATMKSFEIVKKDSQVIDTDDEGEFSKKTQIEALVECYTEMDPDLACEIVRSQENDKKVLAEEASFMIKAHLMQKREADKSHWNWMDDIRFKQLKMKYKLDVKAPTGDRAWLVTPLLILFADEEYNLKQGNPNNFARSLPKGMKTYKNFKKEYYIDGIFVLLPHGKNYGGFVKAAIHLHFSIVMDDIPELIPLIGGYAFQRVLGFYRSMYHSTLYSNEKRIEFFQKLDIKEQDCALWSRLFDQQYPRFKDIYKFFGQVA